MRRDDADAATVRISPAIVAREHAVIVKLRVHGAGTIESVTGGVSPFGRLPQSCRRSSLQNFVVHLERVLVLGNFGFERTDVLGSVHVQRHGGTLVERRLAHGFFFSLTLFIFHILGLIHAHVRFKSTERRVEPAVDFHGVTATR